MEQIRETQKKYSSQAIISAILIAFVFILFAQKGIAKGLILGTLFSIINFVLMGESIPLKLGKSKNKTFLLSLSSILFRYILMAVPLFIGLRLEAINFFAVVVGLFFRTARNPGRPAGGA
jgi:predicted lysophospholipase L1 biosynthesis ABC-type transport system permease subunit